MKGASVLTRRDRAPHSAAYDTLRVCHVSPCFGPHIAVAHEGDQSGMVRIGFARSQANMSARYPISSRLEPQRRAISRHARPVRSTNPLLTYGTNPAANVSHHIQESREIARGHVTMVELGDFTNPRDPVCIARARVAAPVGLSRGGRGHAVLPIYRPEFPYGLPARHVKPLANRPSAGGRIHICFSSRVGADLSITHAFSHRTSRRGDSL